MTTTTRMAIAAAAVAMMWLFVRSQGWAGPGGGLPLVPEIAYPGIVIISLWGLARLVRSRNAP